MPSSTFFGMQHLNNNLLCSISIDTTGDDPDLHEVVEVCVVPISSMLDVHPELMLFNMSMTPDSQEFDRKASRKTLVEMAKLYTEGIPSDKVADYFVQWFNGINLPYRKKIIPLGFRYPVTRAFLIKWLGWTTYSECFSEDYRDIACAAHYVNDKQDIRGETLTFSKQNLAWIARQLHVEKLEQGGSPCDDARVMIQCYNRILRI